MKTISILPEGENLYRALAGDKESTGRTAGEALDALSAQLTDEAGPRLVIVQDYEPDEFFTAAQQERLTELMRRHKADGLSAEEERELEGLVEAELNGARLRAESLLAANAGAVEPAQIAMNSSESLEELLSLLESLTPEEIAETLNADANKVRQLYSRMRAKLFSRSRPRRASPASAAAEKSEEVPIELDDLTA